MLKTGRGLGHHPTARGPAWSRSRPGPRQWAAPREPHSLQLSPEHRVPAARTHHSGSHGDRCLALPDGAFHTESQGVCEQLLGAPRPRGPARAAGLGWERLPPWAPPPLGTPVPLLTKDTPGGLTGQQTSCPQASTVHVPPASSQLLLGPHCRAEDPSHLLSQPEPRAPQAPRKPARPEQGRTVAGLRLWRSTVTPPPPLPASSVLAREGAGCGSVGDVSGAWLASAPLWPSLWTPRGEAGTSGFLCVSDSDRRVPAELGPRGHHVEDPPPPWAPAELRAHHSHTASPSTPGDRGRPR